MNEIQLPSNFNYIGAFLTFRCNMACPYCLNRFSSLSVGNELPLEDWVKGLSRIRTTSTFPITLQGGEPTIYRNFYNLALALWARDIRLDLLTNGAFDLLEFTKNIHPKVFRREAKYASIRFSLHTISNINNLIAKVWKLKDLGYEVGVWVVEHPLSKYRNKVDCAIELCKKLHIDIRRKPLLWEVEGTLTGTYRYKDACTKKERKRVLCRPSELLIAPDGYIYRCHSDLYSGEGAVGHILDKEIKLGGFKECSNFGFCNPCDIKVKFNRFQEMGHCSVEIKEKGKEIENDKTEK